jgi:hypothetical protein
VNRFTFIKHLSNRMKILLVVLALVLLSFTSSFSQATYYHTLQVVGRSPDLSKAMISNADFIVCGSSNRGFFALNTDDLANPKWAKTLDSLGEGALDMIVDYSGNYVVCGAVDQPPSWNPIQCLSVVAFDRQGDTLWTMSYPAGYDVYSSSITQLLDSSYLVIGNSINSGIIVIQLSKTGTPLRGKTIVIPYDEGGSGQLLASADGGFIIVRGRFEILKFDASCNAQWVKNYVPNVLGNYYGARIGSLSPTNDGGFIGTGYYADTSQGIVFGGAALVKLDSNYNVTWSKWYEGSTRFTYCGSVEQTSDFGYVACGDIGRGALGGPDILGLKTDSSGNLLWAKRYGKYDNEQGISVHNYQGGYVLFGTGYDSIGDWTNNIEVIKTNTTGETTCNYSDVSLLQGSFVLNLSSRTYSDTIISGFGSVNTYINTQQVTLDSLCSVSNSIADIYSSYSLRIYPNPATNELNTNFDGLQIEQVRIYNVDGQVVTDSGQTASNRIDISNLSVGVYIAEVRVGKVMKRVRWVKM